MTDDTAAERERGALVERVIDAAIALRVWSPEGYPRETWREFTRAVDAYLDAYPDATSGEPT